MLTYLKLWRQLCLAVASAETTGSVTRCHRITIYLMRDQDKNEHPHPRKHKLDHAPSQNVRPPPGVSTVALDCVRLDMLIRRFEPQALRGPKRRKTEPNFGVYASRDFSSLNHVIEPDLSLLIEPCEIVLPRSRKRTATKSTLAGSEWLIASEDEYMVDSDMIMLPKTSHPQYCCLY